MKFNEMKKLGLIALTFFVVSSSATAGNNVNQCKMTPDMQSMGFDTYRAADGTEISGKCGTAIKQAAQQFDDAIDKNVVAQSPTSVGQQIDKALFSMTKYADTNPAAKELQDFYRQMRADFVNDSLVENKFTTLSTKEDVNKPYKNTQYVEKAAEYFTKDSVLSRINQLREPLLEKSIKMNKYGK